jgi:hypothetical protein
MWVTKYSMGVEFRSTTYYRSCFSAAPHQPGREGTYEHWNNSVLSVCSPEQHQQTRGGASLLESSATHRRVFRGTREQSVVDDGEDARCVADAGLLIATNPHLEDAAATQFFSHLLPQADRFRLDVAAWKALATRNLGALYNLFNGNHGTASGFEERLPVLQA